MTARQPEGMGRAERLERLARVARETLDAVRRARGRPSHSDAHRVAEMWCERLEAALRSVELVHPARDRLGGQEP